MKGRVVLRFIGNRQEPEPADLPDYWGARPELMVPPPLSPEVVELFEQFFKQSQELTSR